MLKTGQIEKGPLIAVPFVIKNFSHFFEISCLFMTDIPVVTTWHRLNNTFHFLTKGSGSPFNIFCCKNTGYNGSSCCTASLQFFNIIQADTANGYYRDLYRCADCLQLFHRHRAGIFLVDVPNTAPLPK